MNHSKKEMRGLRAVDVAASILLVLMSGCGGGEEQEFSIGKVSGKVTFEGNPVNEGRIFFAATDGFGSQSTLGADGGFSIVIAEGAGLKVGSYKVSIKPPPAPTSMPGAPASGGAQKEYPNIPEKYREFSTSGFTAEVKDGDNTFEFDMKP